jgi:hypothetical protein
MQSSVPIMLMVEKERLVLFENFFLLNYIFARPSHYELIIVIHFCNLFVYCWFKVMGSDFLILGLMVSYLIVDLPIEGWK